MNIVNINDINKVLEDERKVGKVIVATNGCFDILHIGHLHYLEKSKQLGDILVVGLNSDASVRELKGDSRPVNKAQDRAQLLAALKPVDYVVIFDELDASSFLQAVQPHIYSKGADYSAEDLPEYPTTQELGAKIVLIDLVPGHSTSNLINSTN